MTRLQETKKTKQKSETMNRAGEEIKTNGNDAADKNSADISPDGNSSSRAASLDLQPVCVCERERERGWWA